MRSPTTRFTVINLFCVLALFSAKGFAAALPSSSDLGNTNVLPTTSGSIPLPSNVNPGGPIIPVSSGVPIPSKSLHSHSLLSLTPSGTFTGYPLPCEHHETLSSIPGGSFIPTSCATPTPLPTGTIDPSLGPATKK